MIEVEYGNDDLVPDDIEMSNGKAAAHDNPAYQADQQDSISHKTTSTGVCETSQTEYISKNGGVNGHLAVKSEEAGDGKSPPPSTKNVKMVFQHNDQVSMTPSMDEADAEVAGIYKKFASNSPLTVRMEHMEATPPPKKKPPPKTGTYI